MMLKKTGGSPSKAPTLILTPLCCLWTTQNPDSSPKHPPCIHKENLYCLYLQYNFSLSTYQQNIEFEIFFLAADTSSAIFSPCKWLAIR